MFALFSFRDHFHTLFLSPTLISTGFHVQDFEPPAWFTCGGSLLVIFFFQIDTNLDKFLEEEMALSGLPIDKFLGYFLD